VEINRKLRSALSEACADYELVDQQRVQLSKTKFLEPCSGGLADLLRKIETTRFHCDRLLKRRNSLDYLDQKIKQLNSRLREQLSGQRQDILSSQDSQMARQSRSLQ
jgi:hypothetical protein